mgnify:FL=1
MLSANETSRNLARNVVDQLQAARVKILGAVLNKVNVKQNGQYGRYYGAYYGHYGKGEETASRETGAQN